MAATTETRTAPAQHEPEAVDLSQIKPKYSVNSKSTLRNVLTEYGLPQPQQEQRKRDKPKRPKKKSEEESWSETDHEKQKAKQQHYLQIYEDVYKLKDLYYMKYMHALRKHVDKQREGIQKKDKELKQQLEVKEAKEAENKAKVRQRMQKHSIAHDDGYLKSIPKSDYYKITQLIEQKKREGGLRTQFELDEFWSEIRKPEVFRRYFPPTLSGGPSTMKGSFVSSVPPLRSRSSTLESLPAQTVVQTVAQQPEYRPMTHISEHRESSNLGMSDVLPDAPREAAPDRKKSSKKQDPYSVARQAAQDLDKRFPKMELPPLHCFNMEIGEKPPDPEEVMREMMAQQRERDRKAHVRKLRRMYQLALSNTASAQRIIASHASDVGMIEPSVAELTIEWSDCAARDVQEDEAPWHKYLSKRQMVPIAEVSEKSLSSASSSRVQRRKGSSKSAQSSTSETAQAPEPPQYLTLGSMATGSKVMEPKCMSTFWTNYVAQENKPFFLTEDADEVPVA